ncbi:glycosyltransferase [bacterium]|nr:glycosyltransferase [bacterium]
MIDIIIPILNEQKILPSSLKRLLELQDFAVKNTIKIIIVDGGSADDSYELITKYCETYNNFFCDQEKIKNPSIIRTLNIAKNLSTANTILILPIDCYLSLESLKIVINSLALQDYDYGGLAKKYAPNGPILSLYCKIQNLIRTSLLKNLVWTNCIFLKRDIFFDPEVFIDHGFMEDVYLSDKLKKEKFKFKYINTKLEVSSRRYIQDSPYKRILINLIVIFLFRIGLKSPSKLKKIYTLTS